jgi:hypothetical protein
VLPFGLTNAPSVFISIINGVIADLLFAVVYLDDILIFSKTPKEHVRYVEEIFNRLRLHHLFLKMEKCEFFKSEIPYLGHLITKDGKKTDTKKISAIKDWPTPTSDFDVRSFSGLANYFRRCINHFSEMASPLINLTKGNTSKRKSSKTNIQWNTECQKSLTS